MKFKDEVRIEADSLVQDLLDGHIEPSEVLINKVDAEIVERAIEILRRFKRDAIEQEVLIVM